MNFREFPAEPSLSPFVECLWTLDSQDTTPPTSNLVTPDGSVELVFTLQDSRVEHSRELESARSPQAPTTGYILGLTTRPSTMRSAGPVHLVGVRLRPAGALRLLGPDLAHLKDRAAPISDLLPSLDCSIRAAAQSEDPHRFASHL